MNIKNISMILTMAFIAILPNFSWAQSGSTETSGHSKGTSEKSHMMDHSKMNDTAATKAKSVVEPIDHSKMDHSKMDRSKMNDTAATKGKSMVEPMDHSKMDHSKMDHSKMDHSKMDHSKMDHSKMDHSKMDHSKMDRSKLDRSKM